MFKPSLFFVLVVIIVVDAKGQEVSQTGPVPTAAQSISSGPSMDGSKGGELIEGSRWFTRVGLLGAVYHSGATIATNGTVVPGATVEVSHDVSLTLDIGYDITKNIFTSLMVGIPPKPTITGQGSVAELGELGAVRYAPGILSGGYRFRRWGAFQPYAGPGVVYALILNDQDGSVSHLHVRNNFGFVLQTGVEYSLHKKWSLFVDFKEIWLGVDAHGFLGEAPVTAHVKLNPSLFSAGFKYYF